MSNDKQKYCVQVWTNDESKNALHLGIICYQAGKHARSYKKCVGFKNSMQYEFPNNIYMISRYPIEEA